MIAGAAVETPPGCVLPTPQQPFCLLVSRPPRVRPLAALRCKALAQITINPKRRAGGKATNRGAGRARAGRRAAAGGGTMFMNGAASELSAHAHTLDRYI